MEAGELHRYVIMGELSLDGGLQPVKGVLPVAIQAKKEGFKGFILPRQNAREAAVVSGLAVYGADNLVEVFRFFNRDEILRAATLKQAKEATQKEFNSDGNSY